MFKVDLKRQVFLLTPYAKRRTIHVLWLSVLTGFSVLRLKELKKYRADNHYILQFSASRIYLQHFLNDSFDPINRAICIDNVEFINPKYRFNKIEDRNVYVTNKAEGAPLQYLFNKSEIDNQAGFIIYVPSTIELDAVMRLRIRQAVDVFNICTINYEIVSYE